jgi:hypothetical protein
VFTVEDRDRARDRLLELASSDPRVIAGAVVGSLALEDGDRWSDLDLTFGVADGVPVGDVLEDWTRVVVDELAAVQLFDLPSGAAIYRVVLLPGLLQVDLSFSPASAFAARGPKFHLLFGTAVDKPFSEPPHADELFGYAAHHALRARFSIERGRFWQAEYWISGARDYALALACRRRGLPAHEGRGFDDLPVEVRQRFAGSLVQLLDRDELLRALGVAVEGLLEEGGESADEAAPILRDLLPA